MEEVRHWIDGKIDFQGQRLADRIMQEGLVFGAVLAFLLGYFTQNMQLCMLTFAASTLLVAMITVPPWGFFNKHQVEWLPSSTTSETAEQDKSTPMSSNTSKETESNREKGKKTITVKTSITTQVN